MIRTVPFGIEKEQIIRPVIASIMTNDLTAKAKVRYRVTVCYPGGVIVEPVDDLSEPRGLLKAGTPVHVEGEPDPTEEELAPYVVSGHVASESHADAADFVEKKPPARATTSAGSLSIFPARKVAAPKQAATICEILIEAGRTSMMEWEIIGTLAQHRGRLNTRQDVRTVFKYYKPKLVEAGFLAI